MGGGVLLSFVFNKDKVFLNKCQIIMCLTKYWVYQVHIKSNIIYVCYILFIINIFYVYLIKKSCI